MIYYTCPGATIPCAVVNHFSDPLNSWLFDSYSFELKVQFDITFPALACSIISLDAMDISGAEHLDVVSLSLSLSLLLSSTHMLVDHPCMYFILTTFVRSSLSYMYLFVFYIICRNTTYLKKDWILMEML